MSSDKSSGSALHTSSTPKPYCSIGSGPLTSFLWKSGDANKGWRYHYNVFRLTSKGGRLRQLFAPCDLIYFVKLIQVLASVISDDGCLSVVDRGVLRRLSADLDNLLRHATTPRSVSSEPNTDADATHP